MFETLEDVAQRMDLRAGMARLPAEQQRIVELFLMGYSQDEIGAALRLRQQRVSELMRAAVGSLREA